METVKVDLPDALSEFVRERVADGGYASVDDYIRALIQVDRLRREEDRIDAMLLDGLNSGDPIEAGPEFWEEKKRRLAARYQDGG